MSSTNPPVGFRKSIPLFVKLKAVLRAEGRCRRCNEKLGDIEDIEFDHVPALQLRGWDADLGDTVPKANDPEYIDAIHKDCHKAKTSGRKGTSKLSKVGGDTSEIAKLRRLEKDQARFRERLLAKGEEDGVDSSSPKRKWPKRPFPTRAKHDEAHHPRRRQTDE